MAAPNKLSALAAAFLVCSLARVSQCGGAQNYTSMFSFGDSLTDTGNLLVSSPLSNTIVGRFPYGITYFHRPTGRCSDGRLVVDFLGALSCAIVAVLVPFLSLMFRVPVTFLCVGYMQRKRSACRCCRRTCRRKGRISGRASTSPSAAPPQWIRLSSRRSARPTSSGPTCPSASSSAGSTKSSPRSATPPKVRVFHISGSVTAAPVLHFGSLDT
jgi:hypothetical protein